MLRKKFTAVAMSAVLAVSLCPGLAVAAPLTGGSVATPAKTTQTVKTQAKKTTVYLLTGYTSTDANTYYDSYDGTVSTSKSETPYEYYKDRYTYDSKGLLTSDGNWDLTYKGVNLKSAVPHVDPQYPTTSTETRKFSFKSKKGLVKSATYSYSNPEATNKYSTSSARKAAWKYTYNKSGNMTKAVKTNYGWSYGDKYYSKLKKTSTNTRTLTLNKKGLPTKVSGATKYIDKSTSTSAKTTYSYDKKKNLKKSSRKNYNPTTYKFGAYKNGVPTTLTVTDKNTKRVSTTGAVVTDVDTTTYTLIYTPVKLSKANAAVAKRQQWALLNGTDLNGAFGNLELGVGEYTYDPTNYYYWDD